MLRTANFAPSFSSRRPLKPRLQSRIEIRESRVAFFVSNVSIRFRYRIEYRRQIPCLFVPFVDSRPDSGDQSCTNSGALGGIFIFPLIERAAENIGQNLTPKRAPKPVA